MGWQGKPIGETCDAKPVDVPAFRDSAKRRYAIDGCHCDAWKFAPHLDERCPLHVPDNSPPHADALLAVVTRLAAIDPKADAAGHGFMACIVCGSDRETGETHRADCAWVEARVLLHLDP